jgi:uncharacterized protein (TIGR03435 family)
MIRAVVFLACALASATQSETPQTFEAASIKQIVSTSGRRLTPLSGGPGTKSPARLAGTANMKTLLKLAYGVKPYQVSGPAWIDTETYEIAAVVPAGASKMQAAEMLRELLVARFHLAAHRETRRVAMCVLLPGKGGPKLREADPAAEEDEEKARAAGGFERPSVTIGPDGFPQIPAGAKVPGIFTVAFSRAEFLRMKLFAHHQDMDQLAATIAEYLKCPVVDQTGLTGKYDFTLAFEQDPRETTEGTQPGAASENAGPTIFAAVQEQLGLRLEPKRGPVEMVIVDRMDRVPAQN